MHKSRESQCLIFVILFGIVRSQTDVSNSTDNRKVCEHVGSLKELQNVVKNVNSAIDDLLTSSKHRAQQIERNFCMETTTGPLSRNDPQSSDSSVKAEIDCHAIQKPGMDSGVYRIWPRFLNQSIQVYCDMTTDGGGWTVIQRRGDFGGEHVNFYETWSQYKKGFGNVTKEFWLGNDFIFALTNQAIMVLRIDLEDFNGEKRYAKYRDFLVRGEIEKYRMTIGQYDGIAGDSMRTHNNEIFATKDSGSQCAKDYKGGWWYNSCHEANLNGLYHHDNHSSYADGINWYGFRGYYHSMRVSEMKIRPCNC